jgi:hypothetical protein
MSMSQSDEPATPAVRLFQFANSKLVTLQRINDQMAGLIAQRQRVQDELKAVKAQIDELFEREMRGDVPSRSTGTTTDSVNLKMSSDTDPLAVRRGAGEKVSV